MRRQSLRVPLAHGMAWSEGELLAYMVTRFGTRLACAATAAAIALAVALWLLPGALQDELSHRAGSRLPGQIPWDGMWLTEGSYGGSAPAKIRTAPQFGEVENGLRPFISPDICFYFSRVASSFF